MDWKKSLGRVKKYPSQNWVRPLFTAVQKYARVGSRPISIASTYKACVICQMLCRNEAFDRHVVTFNNMTLFFFYKCSQNIEAIFGNTVHNQRIYFTKSEMEK